MTDKITLEDVNTWILKYGELDAPKYSMPPVLVTGVLYRGNSNRLSDVISLPFGVDYTIYYENRPVETLDLSEDYGDSCNLRIVTLSHYPYVNSDVRITVPVETKHLESLNDLNNYKYGYVDSLSNVTGIISNDIHIVLSDDAVFEDCNLTFDAIVTIEGELTVNDSFIVNNSSLSFSNVTFNSSDEGLDYLIVNNGDLRISESIINSTVPFILDKGSLVLEGCSIDCLTPSVPFIYANNTEWSISGNTVSYSETLEYNDFGVCFLRCNDFDVGKLITDNSFHYDNVKVTLEDTDYYLTGNGVCYARLDDDTVYVHNLEVN